MLNKKGFSIIQLLVAIAVLTILVAVAVPNFLGHTREAQNIRLQHDAKLLERAAERYFITNGRWPIGREIVTPHNYTSRIFTTNMTETQLIEGRYFEIDMTTLKPYVRILTDHRNFILRNPMGQIFILEPTTNIRLTAKPIAHITMSPLNNINTQTAMVWNHTSSTDPNNDTIVVAEWQKNNDAITTSPPNGLFSAGSHTVRLRVRNSIGGWSEWTSKTFNVQPKVQLLGVAENAVFERRPINLAVSVDLAHIRKIEFIVNNQVIQTITSSPLNFQWNAIGFTNGIYNIYLRVTDRQGNTFIAENREFRLAIPLVAVLNTVKVMTIGEFYTNQRFDMPGFSLEDYQGFVDKGLAKFDITTIPANAEILSARLDIPPFPTIQNAQRITSAWAAGQQYAPLFNAASQLLANNHIRPEVVSDWIRNPNQNHGLIFTGAHYLDSHPAPRLIVEYR